VPAAEDDAEVVGGPGEEHLGGSLLIQCNRMEGECTDVHVAHVHVAVVVTVIHVAVVHFEMGMEVWVERKRLKVFGDVKDRD
jgi:hypothetical protein